MHFKCTSNRSYHLCSHRCYEVTEITAAELQAPAGAQDRFAGAAVRASLAAAGASNVAMFGTPKWGGWEGSNVC